MKTLEEKLKDLKPGAGRWWKIELVKNASTKPIKVTLMESQVEGRTQLSTPIGHSRTIATEDAVIEAAGLVMVMVGDYAKVVGNYGLNRGDH